MSKIIESLRGDMAALYDAGIIDQKMKDEFDAACLAPTQEFSASDIRELRESLRLSLPAFADCLHTTVAAVQEWEQGRSTPAESAHQLLVRLAKKGA